MKKFGEIFGRKEKREASSWDDLGRDVKFNGGGEVSAMSPDVVKMQEQARRLIEMQDARERAMRAFDKNFDSMNDTAKRAAGRFKGAGK